jgi:hypothetical protein
MRIGRICSDIGSYELPVALAAAWPIPIFAVWTAAVQRR